MLKRVIAILLSLTLVFALAPTVLPAVSAREKNTSVASADAVGLASSKYPAGAIPISSVEELMLICNEYPANGDYYLTTDIDLTARTSEGGDLYNDGAGWLPIGTSGTPFTGTFDGNGHCIIGMTINRPSTTEIAFFGNAKNATIENLTFQNANVTGAGTTAALLANGESVTISNISLQGCSVLGRCNSNNVGGIIAYASGDSIISNCAVDAACAINASISTSSNSGTGNTMGGIAGRCDGTISNCVNAADITSTYFLSQCGGIVGRGNIVQNCSNTGSLIESTINNSVSTGGIAGYAATVSGCVNYGNVSQIVTSEFHGTSDCEIRAAGVAANATTVLCSANYGSIYSAGYATWTTYYGTGGNGHQAIRSCSSTGIVTFAQNIEESYNMGSLSVKQGSMAAITLKGNTVSNCYTTQGTPIGGTTITNCYNISGAIGDGTHTNCYAISGNADEIRTLQQLQQRSTYVAWDFDNIWTMDGNPDYLYPELRNAPENTWQKSVTGIELVSGPDKTEYLEGKDDLDLTGAKIKATYDNGTTEILDVTEDMVSGFDKFAVGTLTITVTYGGYTTTFTVTVIAKSLVSIAVTTLPLKLTYLEGKDALSVEGGVLTLYYNNDTTAERAMELYMVRGFDNTVPGIQTLTVTYYGKSTTYDVEIIAKSLSAISMLQLPTKTSYYEGEAFDPTGGKVKLIYNNDTTGEVALTSDMVSGYHADQIGSQTLTVTYSGKTTTFEVNVLAKQVSSIEIDTLPTKRVYLEGKDQLDVTGGKIRVYYNNNTQELLDMLPEMVSGFDNTVVGTQTLTVTYGGKTTTYQIQVIAKTLIQVQIYSLPYKLTYLVNKDTLNLAGGKLKLVYNNDTFDVIDMTLDMASGFNNTVVGTQWITITYQGFTVQFEIQILDKSAVSISIVSLPSKLTYFEGDELSVAGGKIKVYYDNDETQTLDMTPDMASGFDSSTVGTKTVTITYLGVSTYYAVEITHDYQPVVVPPTCTEQGYTIHVCSRCGDSYVDTYVNALGHAWGSWTQTSAPTCTEQGEETRTCTRCGATETRPVDALGHDYQDVVVPPTCTEQGYTIHACSRCGDNYVDTYVGALGHAWDEGVVVQEPTETEPGLRRYTCSRCGATRDEVIPSPGHEHSYTAVVTPPTCTEQGYTTYTCSCGDSYVDDYVPALGHDFGSWTQTTAPTCTEPGVLSRTCSRCGETETSPINPLGHDWEEPEYVWADDNASVTATRVCKRDSKHTQIETVSTTSQVIQEPTADKEGLILYIAVFTNTAFQTQTKTAVLPKLALENPFVDVKEGKYYYTPVLWAYYHDPQITNGTDATHFSPNNDCTRAQIVTFLWKAAGAPEPETTNNPFTDVKEGKYYYKAVLWAVENGITNGVSADKFGVNQPCKREQAVTFLWKAAGAPEPETTENPFTDVKEGKFYYKAVLWAVENGITNGISADKFGVGKTCTRGQIVTFLYKFMEE